MLTLESKNCSDNKNVWKHTLCGRKSPEESERSRKCVADEAETEQEVELCRQEVAALEASF